MSGIFLTGASGFVGQNLVSAINPKISIKKYSKGDKFTITENIVIHIAGKAHDLKITANSDEYYQINTELTKVVFDAFLSSEAKVFITLSSVKAVADEVRGELKENQSPNPVTHYGKSKLLAEQYIFSKEIPQGKRVYVLRPCMIHGPGNKGNLNLLFNLVSKGIPWPLGAFDNKRSFCSIGNLLFIMNELIDREDIPSGIYNIADDEPLSTNQVISLICKSLNKKPIIFSINKNLIKLFAKIGDIINLPLNSERLTKLTESYHVSNLKIRNAIGKDLPVDSKIGLIKTFQSFNM